MSSFLVYISSIILFQFLCFVHICNMVQHQSFGRKHFMTKAAITFFVLLNLMNWFLNFKRKICYVKHEYLRSRAYICLSLSSPVPSHISIKSWTIEILVLTSWIPASKNFGLKKLSVLLCNTVCILIEICSTYKYVLCST